MNGGMIGMAELRASDKYHKIVIISGGFDPLHKGHIEYMKKAKLVAPQLICILNSDKFLMNKKGFVFQNFEERKIILESIKYVDVVVPCIDEDQTVCKTLEYLSNQYGYRSLIFAKGGDRNVKNIPELAICKQLGIRVVDGLGDKIQSSSSLVKGVK